MKRYSFKIIFIGATGCGKTSIINVSNKEPFCNLFTSTIGVDFMSLNIERELISSSFCCENEVEITVRTNIILNIFFIINYIFF